MTELLMDGETWVGIGTFIFLAILIWKKVPALIAKALDARAATIAKELEDARRLREDAEALLAQYRSKQAAAETEAASIVTAARVEAEHYATEARAAIALQIERRGRAAQEKIAQAEAQVIAEIRSLAADAAISAAEKIIVQRLGDVRANGLIKDAIKEIPGKLN